MSADAAAKRMGDTPIGDVSDTAFWIAHYRAVETQRADALFRDPLAATLAGESGARIAREMPRAFITEWAVVMRTWIIDDYLRAAAAEGVDLVLNLGAGLDTRPYRLKLPPALLWIEADYPAMIDYKEQKLAGEEPRCRLERAKLDLSDSTARRQFLTESAPRGKKILILTEGVVPYLTNENVAALADDLRALEPARYWVLDYFSPWLLKHRPKLMGQKMQNAPFRFKPGDWFGFFEGHGWRRKEVRYFAEEARRRGRRLRMPWLMRAVTLIRAAFTPKEWRTNHQRLVGFALLERIPASSAPER